MKSIVYLIFAWILSSATMVVYGAGRPDWVTVDSIVYAGSGCPAGSVSENVSDDRLAFTLLFDSFVAELGPFSTPADARRNCQINIAMNFPQGWSYSIVSMDYRGYAGLDPGVQGTQKSTYFFQGQGESADLVTDLVGPYDDDFAIHDTLGIAALVWSPCGAQRSLNVNTQIRLADITGSGGQGVMTVDSIDGEVAQKFHVQWRRCDGAGRSIFQDDFEGRSPARHWRVTAGGLAQEDGALVSTGGWGAPAKARIVHAGMHQLADADIHFQLSGTRGRFNLRTRGLSGGGYILDVVSWPNGSGKVSLTHRPAGGGPTRTLASHGIGTIDGDWTLRMNGTSLEVLCDGMPLLATTAGDAALNAGGPVYLTLLGAARVEHMNVMGFD